jgi:hypothetical protein
MRKPLDIFHEIPCLMKQSTLLNGLVLQKKWFKSADKRFIGQCLQKFIDYNSSLFNFIGVEPYIVGIDQSTSITFRSSQYIGTIPLRASDTGKQIGDFVVIPRFTGKNKFEDYIEILNLLGNEISPQTIDSLPLASGRNFRPPMYLEAVKFIQTLEELIKRRWRKFDRVEKLISEPLGQVNWKKYSQNEYKVENQLSFPTGKNILSEFHKEYSQIRYVFDLCKSELLSQNTPQRIKLSQRSKLTFIEERLYNHIPVKTNLVPIKSSDSPTVIYCKAQANKILNYNFIDSTAWRIDFSDVFEKFVQYIFKEVAKELGGRLLSNYKFKGYSLNRYSWELNHVEPDAIFQKEDLLVFIDAKYKSHLYNKYDNSELLKEEHRYDLHQIMAYTSFTKMQTKYGILCYPSDKIEIKNIEYINAINKTSSNIKILGLPLKKDIIKKAKSILIIELTNLSEK